MVEFREGLAGRIGATAVHTRLLGRPGFSRVHTWP